MRRLSSDHFVDAMGKDNPPAYTMDDGETAVVETLDCRGGYVSREHGTMAPNPPGPNPATGPIEIKGSVPGEALAVTIERIECADWGFIGGGDEKAEGFTIVEMEDGLARYPWGLTLPLDPIIGVIGTAPPGDPIPTTTPSDWGGNLDTADMGPGATVYLPVSVPGAMLALGDVHALQGDGECNGTGIECGAEVTLTVRRVSDPIWPTTHLVRDDSLMLFAHGVSIDEAAWGAVEAMTRLLSKLTGISESQARRLFGTAGQLRISQIVNPKKTCRAIIPRAAISAHWPF